MIVEVALAVPLYRTFDYLAGEHQVQVGMRVRVPFGARQMIGVVTAHKEQSDFPQSKLRAIQAVLDEEPVLDAELLSLLHWASQYYLHPLGEVLQQALPIPLRQGQPASFPRQTLWRLTSQGQGFHPNDLRGARQRELLQELQRCPQGLSQEALKTLEYSPATLKALQSRELIESFEREKRPHYQQQGELLHEVPLSLNADQQAAKSAICAELEQYQCWLLEGITGSGKTEVYLQVMSEVLRQGKQVLVLVPEIGLTPQTLRRFKHRFNLPIAIMHSGLSDQERLQAWLQAKHGLTPILIGTRSALLTPLPKLGMIIIDEEHDTSFKQQEGFRYHARDLALVRAKRLNIPVILGSATPSLESLHNVSQGRFAHLQLKQRAGNASPPPLRCLSIRQQALHEGMSAPLLASIQNHLKLGQQVLIFLNRRGFAPSLHCPDCGWLAQCDHCDARMTLHKGSRRLLCHHCEYQQPIPLRCPQCHGQQLTPVGQGTERSEESLQQLFPDVPVIRIDRDSTRQRQGLEKLLAPVHQGEPCILIGTQMLAKGHHFPHVTLVAILDADQGLFSADFRGMERMAQLLIQVAGRAGRAELAGEVLIQSEHADHPMLQLLCQQGYAAFAAAELAERQHVQLPPWQHLALIRADHPRPGLALDWLQQLQQQWPTPAGIQLSAVMPAAMEKRHGRYRALIHLSSQERRPLHQYLQELISRLEQSKLPHELRWSVDIDPADTF